MTVEKNKQYSIAYLPIIETYDDLMELYYKMVWMSFPVVDQLNSVNFFLSNELLSMLDQNPSSGYPAFLDPNIVDLPDKAFEKILFVPAEDKNEAGKIILNADVIFNWKNSSDSSPYEEFLEGKEVLNVDKHAVTHDTWIYHFYFTGIDKDYNTTYERSLQRFNKMREEVSTKNFKNAFVFGTGPSATKALEMNMDDSLTIVSNGIVLNNELMDYLRPEIITGIDPLYHSGPSLYAGKFREALREAIEKYGSYFVTRIEFCRWFTEIYPEDVASHIIGIPVLSKKGIPELTGNKDKEGGFNLFNGNGNVLAASLLPLSLSLTNEVNILGCDGRPPAKECEQEKIKYFWKHESKSTIDNWEEITYQAAPFYFDSRDFENYHNNHNEYLGSLLKSAKEMGKTVRCRAYSHLPALKELYEQEPLEKPTANGEKLNGN